MRPESAKHKSEPEHTSPKDASKATTVNPKDILFTTPTLNDALPAASGAAIPVDGCYRMHEDNWRQFEFISSSFASEIASEVAAIDKIWKEQSVPLGENATAFKSVHVRKRIIKPLDISMSLDGFQTLFGERVSPITLIGYDRTLGNVHAIRLKNVIIYGAIQDGRLITLGVEAPDRFAISGETANRLEEFIIKHDLRLVHWPSRTVFETPPAAMKYLRGNGG